MTMTTKCAVALAAMGLAAALPAVAQTGAGDVSRQSTQVKFDQPVEIPGKVLQPGTYTFKLINSDRSKQQTVQVFDASGSTPVATLLTSQAKRGMAPNSQSTVFVFVDPNSASGSSGTGSMGSGSGSTYGSGSTAGTGSSGSTGSTGGSGYGSGSTGGTSSGSYGSGSGSSSSSSSGMGGSSSSSTAGARPMILKAWFYPGNQWGQEFIYSQDKESVVSGGQEKAMAVGSDMRLQSIPGHSGSGTGSGSSGSGTMDENWGSSGSSGGSSSGGSSTDNPHR